MRSFSWRPPLGRRTPQHPQTYSVHPLPALGGVFAYVEQNGEGIGLFFGKSEAAVATAVADGLVADALEFGPGPGSES